LGDLGQEVAEASEHGHKYAVARPDEGDARGLDARATCRR
ncbi:MAG: hypothetical protein K0S49_2848, partial [Microbacterium sp.]|nr:hypothetical protein [Microbacterium sp.]